MKVDCWGNFVADVLTKEQRHKNMDVVRTGVVMISVSFSVAQKWLRLLTRYKQQEKIRVGFFDPETVSVRQTEMYVEGFKAKIKKDTSYKGLWIVSFTLKEL